MRSDAIRNNKIRYITCLKVALKEEKEMSLAAEKLEGNMAELTITVPAEEFDKAMIDAYK